MKAGGGKSKGSEFERDVCKQLSLWISSNKRNDIFWRSSISGGRATVAAKRGREMAHVAGDICAVHPDGHNLVSWLYWELKFYRQLQIDHFVVDSGGTLWKFWVKACKEADKISKHPVLVARQNRMRTVMLVFSGTASLCLNVSSDQVLASVGQVLLVDFERWLLRADPKNSYFVCNSNHAAHTRNKPTARRKTK